METVKFWVWTGEYHVPHYGKVVGYLDEHVIVVQDETGEYVRDTADVLTWEEETSNDWSEYYRLSEGLIYR